MPAALVQVRVLAVVMASSHREFASATVDDAFGMKPVVSAPAVEQGAQAIVPVVVIGPPVIGEVVATDVTLPNPPPPLSVQVVPEQV